ncbi:MAG: pseudouridine synthase [Candidatus Verstraetearchaeota archaeon]|jgi:predicted RNA-binding protein (TIGR00451 family)|nr:pseudouridine synthase [Candidatus Verstraetearchaeota archaeon]
MLSNITKDELIKIRAIADLQFGKGCGQILFPEEVMVIRSKRTGKIKNIYHNGKLLATLRTNDGYLALSIEGAKRLILALPYPKYRVCVKDEAIEFLKKGRNLFSKHVLICDEEIRPGEEVIIVDSKGNVIAVGKSLLSGREMMRFKNGIAVKVRSGVDEEN